jgi:hypothetical protein
LLIATPRVLLIAAVSLASVAQSAFATPASEPDAAIPASTRPEKIRELVSDLGYGADFKHVDAAVPYLTANVAPNDPTWTETNPRWRSVSALIGQNLRADAEAQFSESESAIVENAVRAMSDGVVREDLDAALTFFRSATGRRFLDFQRSLMDLSIEVNLTRDTTASSPSVEGLDRRKRVLGLWFPIVFLRVMYGPETAERALDSAYRSFSRPRGRELDDLERRYAEELPQFEQFVQSVSFRRIINAEMATEHVMPEPDLAAFFAAEAKQHGAEWKAAARGS